MNPTSVRGEVTAGQGSSPLRDTEADIGTPIFVVGYMHSGTTLLREILARSPAVHAVRSETRFFERGRVARPQHVAPDDLPRVRAFAARVLELLGELPETLTDEEVLGALAAAREAGAGLNDAGLFRALLDAVALRRGRERWIEKTPGHVMFVDDILARIPDAHVLEIVRDPRDVLASKKTRRDTVWTTERYTPEERPAKSLEKSFDTLWDSLAWKAAVRAGEQGRATHPARMRRVGYERLVQDPEAVVREICRWVDLAFDPRMLDVGGRNTADGRPAVPSGIRSDSVGRWRSVLTPPEVALCQIVARPCFTAAGYVEEDVPAAQKVRVPPLVARSAIEFGDRLRRRAKSGGLRAVAHAVGEYARSAARLVLVPRRDERSGG